MKVDRKTLEEYRHEGYRVYGYKHSYCKLQNSCEECDKKIRFLCIVIRKIEDVQTKRILKICKGGGVNE